MNPQIEQNFRHHPPRGNAAEKHEAVRAKAKELALLIEDLLPPKAGREKATALTKCEEAMMWANAGIARHSESLKIFPMSPNQQQATGRSNLCDETLATTLRQPAGTGGGAMKGRHTGCGDEHKANRVSAFQRRHVFVRLPASHLRSLCFALSCLPAFQIKSP